VDDAEEDTNDGEPVDDADEDRAVDADDAEEPTPPVSEGCDGCSTELADRPSAPLTLCMAALLWVVCRRRPILIL
jgi:MYXO-CTERM domain-containing protein